MTEQKYNMSFTTGGLFFNESLSAASLYLSLKNWKTVREQMLADNLIQARTKSSAVRICREVCKRLETLNMKEITLLENGTTEDQRYLLWVAVCKRYRLIREFMTDVVREKLLRMDLHLSPRDYDIFFDDKAEAYPELEQLKDSTRAKLRQVLFKILREAEIISKENMIIPGLPTKELLETLARDDPSLLGSLPVSGSDIKEMLQ